MSDIVVDDDDDPRITGSNIPYIPRHNGAFDVYAWLSQFHDAEIPPLPVVLIDTEDMRLDYTKSWAHLMESLAFSEENILGYPLVERIPLAVVRNRDHLVTDNYYRAESWYMSVSVLIYGHQRWWFLVKAEHALFFRAVLSDPSHERHMLYRRINEELTGPNGFNLMERLSIPHCDVHHEQIQQVTADLYGLFLVVFVTRRNGFQELISLQSRGVYNATHKMIRFSAYRRNGEYREIYEPMIVQPSRDPMMAETEWRFPRVTYDSTRHLEQMRGYKGSAADSDGARHPLRKDPLSQEVPNALAHFKRPRLSAEHLEIALGCQNGDPDNPNTWYGGPVRWTLLAQRT
ncbi:hypothetical protein ACMFMG_001753 [Clarireedia jacksonii]